MRLCGDWFFYVLLAEQGSVVEVDEPLSYYRQHNSNISSDAEHRGLTFLEGADVLEYMIEHYAIENRRLCPRLGSYLGQIQTEIRFPPEVQKRSAASENPSIDITLILIYNYLKIKIAIKLSQLKQKNTISLPTPPNFNYQVRMIDDLSYTIMILDLTEI